MERLGIRGFSLHAFARRKTGSTPVSTEGKEDPWIGAGDGRPISLMS